MAVYVEEVMMRVYDGLDRGSCIAVSGFLLNPYLGDSIPETRQLFLLNTTSHPSHYMCNIILIS